jgi:hypothetical protein
MAEDVTFDAAVIRGGRRGGRLLSNRAEFLAAYSALKGKRQSFTLVSVLADDVSASLVLRDDGGELLNVLVAFDGSGLISGVTSFRQAGVARARSSSSEGTSM